MGKVDVPPRYVVAPAALVFGDLPRSIVLTGIRIWALGWRYNYEYTRPVREEDLLELLGLGRRQLFEHLKRLVSTGVLRYTTIDARLTFDFTASRLLSRPPPERAGMPSAVFRTGADMSVAVDDVKLSTEPGRRQQQQHNARAREALQALGLLEPTLSEIAELDWVTEAYLASWAAWYEGRRDEVGVGFLVLRWRAGDEAPETRADREKRVRREQYARYNVQT